MSTTTRTTTQTETSATDSVGKAGATMRAARIHGFGDPDVFEVEDSPTPELRAGEVRIKILAAGINRLEDYIRNGDFLTEDQVSFPRILGADASGVIDAIADDVTEFEIASCPKTRSLSHDTTYVNGLETA